MLDPDGEVVSLLPSLLFWLKEVFAMETKDVIPAGRPATRVPSSPSRSTLSHTGPVEQPRQSTRTMICGLSSPRGMRPRGTMMTRLSVGLPSTRFVDRPRSRIRHEPPPQPVQSPSISTQVSAPSYLSVHDVYTSLQGIARPQRGGIGARNPFRIRTDGHPGNGSRYRFDNNT
ncbi:hypothetical protein J3A83DRAFT_4400782 [Scleroderma citrinum]